MISRNGCVVCLKPTGIDDLAIRYATSGHCCGRVFCKDCVDTTASLKCAARFGSPCPICAKRCWHLLDPYLGIDSFFWQHLPDRDKKDLLHLRHQVWDGPRRKWRKLNDDGSLVSDKLLLHRLYPSYFSDSGREKLTAFSRLSEAGRVAAVNGIDFDFDEEEATGQSLRLVHTATHTATCNVCQAYKIREFFNVRLAILNALLGITTAQLWAQRSVAKAATFQTRNAESGTGGATIINSSRQKSQDARELDLSAQRNESEDPQSAARRIRAQTEKITELERLNSEQASHVATLEHDCDARHTQDTAQPGMTPTHAEHFAGGNEKETKLGWKVTKA